MANVPIKWTKEMSVGVESIDLDHQALFSLLERLRVIEEEGGDAQSVQRALSELYNYTDYHFSREELVMEACGYPDLEKHKKAHRKLTDGVTRFIEGAAGGASEYMVIGLVGFLEDWLKAHIMVMDMAYESWTKGKDELIESVNVAFEAKR